MDRDPIIRPTRFLAATAIALALAAPTVAPAQTADGSAYEMILFLAQRNAPEEVRIQRLDEVWSPADGATRLQGMLDAGALDQLEEVTIVPGRETPAVRIGEVTFRVRAVLREPGRDRMFLRVEVDGGREAFVKEMMIGFDETIVLAYPLTEGDRSIVALLLPIAPADG